MLLTGLPGCAADKDAVRFRSFRQCLATLKQGKAVTDAEDYGAINIWIDDAGLYRCESMRHFIITSRFSATAFDTIKPWVIEWRARIAGKEGRNG